MKVSGFYMANGKNSEDAKAFVSKNFQSKTKPVITKKLGRSSFEVIDVVKTPEYDEDNESKAYDVHFVLNLPDVEIEEDTIDFYDLEFLMYTGLGIVEKRTFKVPVTWEVYATVEVEAETVEEAIEIVKKDEDDMPLPTDSYYVDGSFRLSTDNLEELKAMAE